MSVIIMSRSIMRCHGERCTQRVRLWADFRGRDEEFRCAGCLPYTTLSTDQVVGNYVLCSNCQAQNKVTAIKPTPLCFDCQESHNQFDDDPDY